VDALWRVFLLYDGLILGLFRKGAQFASVIRERVGLFLAGNWDVLFNAHLQFRDSAGPAKDSFPFHSDPRDAKARKAQYNIVTHQSLSGGSSTLRANPNPPPPVAVAVTGAFQMLNPQAGDPISRPREARVFIGTQTHDQHMASLLFLRGLGLGLSDATAAPGNGGGMRRMMVAAGLSSTTVAVWFGGKHYPPRLTLTLRRTSGATDLPLTAALVGPGPR